MGIETIMILLLLIFILGMIIGVVLARPNHVHLGALVLIVALGAFVLMMFDGKDITQGVLALESAAVGGLVGVLIPSPIVRKNNAP